MVSVTCHPHDWQSIPIYIYIFFSPLYEALGIEN